MGLLAAQIAKAAGAGTVILTGTNADEEIRFPIARKLPAIDRIVNVQKEDLKAIVMELTDGMGVDTVVECTGAPPAAATAIEVVRRLGRILPIGEKPVKDVSIDWNKCIFKGITIHFNFGSNYLAWHRAMKMIELGTVNVDALITHRIHMRDFRKGFEYLDNKEAVKVMMEAFKEGE